MNNESYFHQGPSVRFRRTAYKMPFNHTTAYNVGDIVPLEVEQIYPGDSWKTKLAFLTRLFTPLAPMMSNMYQDFYAFFVPWRIVWEHTKQFFGENETGAWTQALTRVVPQHPLSKSDVLAGTATAVVPTGFVDPNGNLPPGTIGDYMGLVYPVSGSGLNQPSTFSVSDLYRRAYLQVYNDWFRDENIISPVLFSKGDTHAAGEQVFYWSRCLKAAKFHDYFTSLLPEAMKGDVPIVGEAFPVVPGDEHLTNGDSAKSVKFRFNPSDTISSSSTNGLFGANASGLSYMYSSAGMTGQNFSVPSNLWALSNITIEDIRKASVITHVFEKLAINGSRYPEFLSGMWGVVSSDASLQISEYLGGLRFPIKIQEVLSNADTLDSSAGTGSPIGTTGAFSKTGDVGHLFNKSFTEYGILMIVGVARVEQTYFQGLDRKFTRQSFFDFYLPDAANLGPQPVYTYEANINATTAYDSANKPTVLGYSEAWADLRYLPYRITSIMKPNAINGLTYWTATDILDSRLQLDFAFIQQGVDGLNRTIAVPSSPYYYGDTFQFMGDFKFMHEVVRILPEHSNPGLKRI